VPIPRRRPKVVSGRRGRFAVSDGFRALVLDNLDAVPGLMARSMFGGLGLYSRGVFFAIVAADVLYFKVDAGSRDEYIRRGARPFKPFPSRPASRSYYAVPTAVLENPLDLVAWARRAVRAASREPNRSRESDD
jgi:DNA transformation protein